MLLPLYGYITFIECIKYIETVWLGDIRTADMQAYNHGWIQLQCNYFYKIKKKEGKMEEMGARNVSAYSQVFNAIW